MVSVYDFFHLISVHSCCSMYQWFLFTLNNILLWIYFIHSPVDGYWVLFFFLLWTMLLWTFVTNLCVDIYFHFSWVRNLGVELLDYMINLFNFLRNYQTVFQSGYTILHIVSNVAGYQFLCILTSTYYCVWFQWLGGSSIPL